MKKPWIHKPWRLIGGLPPNRWYPVINYYWNCVPFPFIDKFNEPGQLGIDFDLGETSLELVPEYLSNLSLSII